MDGVNGVVSAMSLGGGGDEVHQDARDEGTACDHQRDGPRPRHGAARAAVSLTQGARGSVAAQPLQQPVGAGLQTEEEDDGTDS